MWLNREQSNRIFFFSPERRLCACVTYSELPSYLNILPSNYIRAYTSYVYTVITVQYFKFYCMSKESCHFCKVTGFIKMDKTFGHIRYTCICIFKVVFLLIFYWEKRKENKQLSLKLNKTLLRTAPTQNIFIQFCFVIETFTI